MRKPKSIPKPIPIGTTVRVTSLQDTTAEAFYLNRVGVVKRHITESELGVLPPGYALHEVEFQLNTASTRESYWIEELTIEAPSLIAPEEELPANQPISILKVKDEFTRIMLGAGWTTETYVECCIPDLNTAERALLGLWLAFEGNLYKEEELEMYFTMIRPPKHVKPYTGPEYIEYLETPT